MNLFFTLFRTNLNLNFGISALKYRFRKESKKIPETLLIVIGILFGFGSLIGLYSFLMYQVFSAGLNLGQPEIVLTIAFVSAQFIILIFGIFYILGVFYFGRDLSMLIPLPLSPYQVLGSKFAIVMINEYLTALPLLVPPIIIYGMGTGQGFFYWVKALILVLATPAIPLTIASIFVIVLMRFANLRKRKDLLTIVGGFVGLLLSLGLNFWIQKLQSGNMVNSIQRLIESDLIKMIGQSFPPSIWATLALGGQGFSGFAYLLLFLFVSLLLLAAMLRLGNQFFYKSVLSGQESTRKRKVLSSKNEHRRFNSSTSPMMAIIIREWRLLLRTPIYVLNGLSGVIIGPFILVLLFFTQGSAGGSGSYTTEQLLTLINRPEFMITGTLSALCIVLFTAGMNLVASTSLSREGQTFWISKMIPVKPKVQIVAKLLQAYSVAFLSVLVTVIMLALFFKFSLLRIAIVFSLGLLGSLPLTALNLLIDVLRPKLIWTNPHEAIKQNLNGLLGMLISIILLLLIGAGVIFIVMIKTPDSLVYGLLALVLLLLTVPSLLGLFNAAERTYRRTEV